jgi:hypothetical protein
MSGTLTPLADALALDYLLTSGTVTRPTAWYVALHAGANGGSGANNELVGNGYARQAVTFSLTGNIAENTAQLTWGPNTGTSWGTVTDVTVWDSSTGGRCLAQGPAVSPVTYAVGDEATMAAGALTVSLT